MTRDAVTAGVRVIGLGVLSTGACPLRGSSTENGEASASCGARACFRSGQSGRPLDAVCRSPKRARSAGQANLPGAGGAARARFLARTFERLRRIGIRGVVSFSDPVPRRADDGRVIFAGHLGTIYQAHNAAYLGRSRPSTLRLLPDGSVLANRALQKLRGGERGWRYVVATLVRFGATPPQKGESLLDWMDLWLLRLTRTLRHRGNHKYAWTLARRNALTGLAYPKGIG
jgi:hypothetical protein